MNSSGQPPWRSRPPHRPPPPTKPTSTVPAKRSIDSQEQAWVAGEDRFVLQQAKRKAAIRVKNGRARPIDRLAVTLRLVDRATNPLDEDEDDEELDIEDPTGTIENLDGAELTELEKEIDTYITLETSTSNLEYWNAMKSICADTRKKFSAQKSARGVHSVSADVDKILSPKSYDQLVALEKQIRTKLRSNEPIDTDYWEHLLASLMIWKAKAKLKKVSQAVVSNRLHKTRKLQEEEAIAAQTRLQAILGSGRTAAPIVTGLDPEPFLKILQEDKALGTIDERVFLDEVTSERQKILKLGYIPVKQRDLKNLVSTSSTKSPSVSAATGPPARFSTTQTNDVSRTATALYEREVARGVDEDEEIFTGEEEVSTAKKSQWEDKYRPRKPRYFNRVQMGYEWNKYNQTHYDHDNPPPKVVQGYKFNVFYPDLIDITKAPTYKIQRENGRKRGESFAPAGEEDTCIVRFVAGPPYEDIAFRIVDKEWDYSSRSDRGFKSKFEDGILNLHFQFKKIYYRK